MNYTSVKTLYIICGYPKMISRFGNLYQLEFSGQGEAEEIIPINNLLQKLIHYGHKIIKSFKCFPRRVIYVPNSHLLVKISHQSCSCFIYFSFRSMLRPKTKTKKTHLAAILSHESGWFCFLSSLHHFSNICCCRFFKLLRNFEISFIIFFRVVKSSFVMLCLLALDTLISACRCLGALQQKEMRDLISHIVKQIWLLSFMNCRYFFAIV